LAIHGPSDHRFVACEQGRKSAADAAFILAYNLRAKAPLGEPGEGALIMFRTAFAAAAVLAAALTMVAGSADAQPRRIDVGTLTCAMSSSIGLIVGSQKNVNCVFRGQPGEPEEAYTGTMTTVGLDIGITTGGVIVWTVFADTNRFVGMLAGKYIGATGEVSIAAGLGANVLVGGSHRTVALQPVSVQGQVGLDVAAGIGELDLHPAQ
jgi:Protein of unknown function (DUF992)